MIEEERVLEPKLFLKRRKEPIGVFNLERHVMRSEIDDLITGKIETLAQGGVVDRRTTVLASAIGGMGKSESCQLALLRANENGLRTAYFKDGDTQESIKATLGEVHRVGEPLVVVIDSPDEIGAAFELSEYLDYEMINLQSPRGKVTNLFKDPRVCIVIGAARRPFPWIMPEMSLTRMADWVDLKPFTLAQTREQLGKMDFDDDQAIIQINQFGGIPQVNRLLAEHWPNVDAAITDYMDNFLSGIGVSGREEKEELRSILTQAAILQSFDEYMVPWHIQSTGNIMTARDSGVGIAERRDVRSKLVGLRLAKWDDGGYWLPKPLRQVLTTHVKFCDRDWLAKAHAGWVQEFRDWAKEFPRGEANWLARAMYHERKLAELL